MHRSAPRLARLLACAAVPVTLVAACSSGSDSPKGQAGAQKAAPSASPSGSPTASASPDIAPAKYAQLPVACKAVGARTVASLVPKAKKRDGTPVTSGSTDERSGCSWNGLNGYQYRWLDVSLQRYDSVAGLGSAEAQATKRYSELVAAAKAAKGATSETLTAAGTWDTATAVTSRTTKDKEEYQDVTVVARSGNAVVALSYNGAGLEDAKTPKADGLRTNAVKAAKEAVVSVAAANA